MALIAESFLKNEATDLYENKGSAFRNLRNEATDGKVVVARRNKGKLAQTK